MLCCTHAGINPVYLQIARESGGSFHTMEEDIVDLITLKEGSKLTIRTAYHPDIKEKIRAGKLQLNFNSGLMEIKVLRLQIECSPYMYG